METVLATRHQRTGARSGGAAAVAMWLLLTMASGAAVAAADEARAELLRLLETPATISREGDAVRFRGLITSANVESLIEEFDRAPTRTLIISSPGGVTDDGRDLGREVHRRRLAVHVDERCNSSCANYVFTAAARRSIGPGGLVLWHGNSLQKDMREWRRCGRSTSSLSGRETLRNANDEYERVRATERERVELEFFASIGVDDYIARVGQEPRFYGNFTLTVADMARFGVRDVQASDDYGTAAFCARVNAAEPGLGLHCVEVTDAMLAHEAARRRLGERCEADGTLRIRPERE